MRIAINSLSARFGGGATYIRNLLENLSRIDRENEYFVFTSPEKLESLAFIADTPNFSIIAPGFPGKAVIRRAIWEQAILPALIKRYKVDVLFSPGGIAPVVIPNSCKRVNMVQNMAPFSDELLASYPLSKRKMRFLMLRKLYPLLAARADANVFISTVGRDKLHELAGLDIEKCKIIYHGRDEKFRPVPKDSAASFVETQYGINEKFILYVSNIARYKKHLEVVEAYHRVREQGANANRLFLAGIMVEPSYYSEVISLARKLGIEDEVTYLGEAPQPHLPYLYSAASVFVFASICENCPNILIEAMACGAAIASSGRDPMPEICGDAALYFDPCNPDDMADVIWRILTDEAVRYELIGNTQRNVERFLWHKTAQRTLETFAEVFVP